MRAPPPAIAALIENARCFNCLPPSIQFEAQTYIMAYVLGESQDPKELAYLAKDFQALNVQTLQEIKTYLLAGIAGYDTDPNSLADRAKCYICIPDGMMSEVQTYLLSIDPNGPGITTPGPLGAAAIAFRDWPIQTLLEIQVYILARLTNSTTDPSELAAAAKCMSCLPFPVLSEVTIAVLDYLEVGGGGGIGPEPPLPCVDDPVQQIPVLQNPTYVGDVLDTFEIRLPQVCCNPSRVQLFECYNPDGTDGVAYQTEFIAAAHAGEVNYVIPITVMAAFNRPYVIAQQICQDGTSSAYSNVMQVGNPAAADVLANAWSTLVQTNGGAAPSAPTVAAVSQFYAEISAYGIGAKIKGLNLFAPDSFIAAMTPQYSTWGSTLWDKINTVAKGFGQCDVGIWGAEPAFNTGIWTGFNPSGAPGIDKNNFGYSVYLTHPDFRVAGSAGCRSGANWLTLYTSFVGASYFDWPDGGGASRINGTLPARFRGFISYNRSGAAQADVWYANRNIPIVSGGSSVGAVVNGLPNAVMYLGAFNDTGTWGGGNERGWSACALHTALNVMEADRLYHAIENFRRTIGGGYIPDTTVADEVVTEMENNITFGSGAAIGAATRAALVNFWDELIAAGIQDKMLTVVPFVPDNLIAATTPITFLGCARNLTNSGFVAGDLTINGLAGDAIGKYLSTVWWIPSNIWFDYTNIGITIYISSGKNEGSNDGGCAQAPAFANAYSVQNFANNMYSDLGPAGGSGRIGPVADAAATGYYSGNRVAANDHRLYKAKSTFAHAQIGSNLNVSADVRGTVTSAMYLFAYNMAGAGGFSSKRMSFWASHLGLSSAESAAFYTAIQNLRTALGGGFV